MEPSVTVEEEICDDSKVYAIKISTNNFEINVRVPVQQAAKLKQVPSTPWMGRSLQLGESAGAAAYWSADDGLVSILVGHDDESWDISATIPMVTFEELLRQLEAVSR